MAKKITGGKAYKGPAASKPKIKAVVAAGVPAGDLPLNKRAKKPKGPKIHVRLFYDAELSCRGAKRPTDEWCTACTANEICTVVFEAAKAEAFGIAKGQAKGKAAISLVRYMTKDVHIAGPAFRRAKPWVTFEGPVVLKRRWEFIFA